jgi:hypothetical protein
VNGIVSIYFFSVKLLLKSKKKLQISWVWQRFINYDTKNTKDKIKTQYSEVHKNKIFAV